MPADWVFEGDQRFKLGNIMKTFLTFSIIVLLCALRLSGAEEPSKMLKIRINTDQASGTLYRFWTTMAMINQDRFNEPKDSMFIESLETIRPFTETYNLVRTLGGRNDGKNNWFKGVDKSGKIITDFAGLTLSLRSLTDLGFKPRLVLDNVPSAMSTLEKLDKYGNSNPPDDYDLWRQYVTAYLQTLIDEFGYEEVKTWRLRVGTEPDLFPEHWSGTKEAFLKHYDITVDAVLQVMPEAEIGPGNILAPHYTRENKWGLDIIDHCAVGTNYATGKVGTPMHFFSFSYYELLNEKTIRFEDAVNPIRERLNKYPQFSDIPLDIQEFGILKDENGTGMAGLHDISEFGASWYAAISDLVYKRNIAEVYEWGAASDWLPHPRMHVIRMLDMMADGKRIDVLSDATESEWVGAIASLKGDRVYILLYNHHPDRKYEEMKRFAVELAGDRISKTTKWSLNEWRIDHDHGVWAYELYADCEVAGLEYKAGSPLFDRVIARTYGNGWMDVYRANQRKYEKLFRFPKTAHNRPVPFDEGIISLDLDMPGNSVRLIELIPEH